MGINCYGCESCGDLDRPPSRSNMSLFAIIELVIMGVCGVLCLIELINMFNSNTKLNEVWTIIQIVVDILIVAGLVFVIYGLFCAPSPSPIRTGIICFVVGAILSLVSLVYQLVAGAGLTVYGLCYMILLFFLAYILWRQSAHL